MTADGDYICVISQITFYTAQLQLVMLWDAKRKGDKVRFAELPKVDVEHVEEGEEEEEGDDLGDLTPPLPVLQMNNDQINQYFPKLIKKMSAMEAGQGKRGRLWASSTEPAGKEKHTFLVDIDYIGVISLYNETAEMILPQDSYKG